MLTTTSYVPDVYGRNGTVARGEARNPSLVLDEKFSYMGGREIKPKEQAADQRKVDMVSHFATTYNSFPDADDGATVWSKLYTFLPDIGTRNVHILAASYYIINRMRKDGGKISNVDDLNVKRFHEIFAVIWSKLEKAFPKAAKMSKEKQVHDVLRYITAILAFEAIR